MSTREEKYAFDVRSLSKHFRGKPILSSANVKAVPGEAIAVVGPNGSGKTTFLRLLLGLLPRDSGSVLLLGRDISELNRDAAALGLVSVVLDHQGLNEALSALENMTFSARIQGQTRNAANLTSVQLLRELGVEAFAKESPAKWSKGMRQRLVLARAFLSDAKLMVMDEPTNGLDRSAVDLLRSKLLTFVREKGGTLVIATHDFALVEGLCSRLIVLVNGRLIDLPDAGKVSGDHRLIRLQGKNLAAVSLESLIQKGLITSFTRRGSRFVINAHNESVAAIVPALLALGMDITEFSPLNSRLSEAYDQALEHHS